VLGSCVVRAIPSRIRTRLSQPFLVHRQNRALFSRIQNVLGSCVVILLFKRMRQGGMGPGVYLILKRNEVTLCQ